MKDLAIQLVDQLLTDAVDSGAFTHVNAIKRDAYYERANQLAERLMLQAQRQLLDEFQTLISDKEASIPPPTSPIITRNADKESLELPKRTYVPFTVTAQCPQCGQVMQRDLSTDYLFCPIAGEPIEISLGHEVDGGDHELVVKVILDFTLKVVPQ